MKRFVAHLGALLVLAVAVTGCQIGGSTAESPTSPPPVSTVPAPPGDRIPAGVSEAAAPGLEIRYLDEDGTPQVLRPQDFPRR